MWMMKEGREIKGATFLVSVPERPEDPMAANPGPRPTPAAAATSRLLVSTGQGVVVSHAVPRFLVRDGGLYVTVNGQRSTVTAH